MSQASIAAMANRERVAERVDAAAEAILAVVRSIPRGRVSTYGLVAHRAGLPRGARLVGRVLSRLPPDSPVPWHRVVGAGGRIAFPAGSRAYREQRACLAREGVPSLRGRVDMDRNGWHGAAGDLDRLLWFAEPPRAEKPRTARRDARPYDPGPRGAKRRSG
jgi:methylated-DNA-protein-cysteine methyltransferase-like protein